MNDPTNPTPSSDQFLLNALCSRCGYDLRANNTSGPCPQCGLQLSYATLNNGLALANPLWLQRIFLGITGLFLCQLLFVAEHTTQLLILVSTFDQMGRFSYWWNRLGDVGWAVFWFSALYLLAAREHSEEKEEFSSPRRLLVWLGCASVILNLIAPLLFSQFAPHFRRAFYHLMYFMNAAANIALFLYLLRLGQRSGDPLLRRHFPIAVALIIVNFALTLIGNIRDAAVGMEVNRLALLMDAAVACYVAWILLQMRRSLIPVLALHRKDIDTVSS